mmetsp:Transcript_42055/g.121984  ORF Transcript_42055/g.121984 Transcript_42055/m.121984 type:complete len:253 (+) Transcript_42055:622-1380(+)
MRRVSKAPAPLDERSRLALCKAERPWVGRIPPGEKVDKGELPRPPANEGQVPSPRVVEAGLAPEDELGVEPRSSRTTTAVISSDIIPSVSLCQRRRAMLVISLAATVGSVMRPQMSTASCELIWSHTPSEPSMRNLSRRSSLRSTTSGCEITWGRRARSPNDRDMASPPIPFLSMTRSGPPRIHRMPPLCMIGKLIWSTMPPPFVTRSRSSGLLGLWSLERSTAARFCRAVSHRPRTARESPTFATKRRSLC